jgi:preprotein translocase subunit SecB
VSLDSARSEAARVAARVDLRDIRVWELSSELKSVPDDRDSQLRYTLHADVNVQHSAESPILLVLGTYRVDFETVSPRDAGDEEAEPESDNEVEVASVGFKLNALFEVEEEPADEPFSESELSAFGETTGRFALYPYARELIADVTGRMGLPPLHLGVMKLRLDSRTGD